MHVKLYTSMKGDDNDHMTAETQAELTWICLPFTAHP